MLLEFDVGTSVFETPVRSVIWAVMILIVLVHEFVLELIPLASAQVRALLHPHVVAVLSFSMQLFV